MSDRTRVRRMFWLFRLRRRRANRLLHGDGAMHRIGIPSRFNATASWRSPETCSTETGSAAGASDLLLPRGTWFNCGPQSVARAGVRGGSRFSEIISTTRFCCSPGAVREWLRVCAYRIAARASGREWIGLWTGNRLRLLPVRDVHHHDILDGVGAAVRGLPVGLRPAADPRRGPSGPRNRRRWRDARPHRPQPADRAVALAVSVAWLLFRQQGRGVALRPRGFAIATAFVLAFAALQVPWVVRNYRVFGDPIVTTTLGGNLYRHNGMIEESITPATHPEMERKVHQLAAASGRPLESLNEAEIDSLLKAEGARIVKAYPLRYLKLSAMRTVWI